MNSIPAIYKTRIAPTPSGYLHLGNAYSFMLTAALAQRCGAKTLLRIDDMDSLRVMPSYLQDIFDTLQFLNIPWQEGPRNAGELENTYSQKCRLSLYEEALTQLKDAGLVFGCNCSRADIARHSSDGAYPGTCLHKNLPLQGNAWRLDTSVMEKFAVRTISGETIQATLPAIMQYFVVRKKDGFPAYQLASLVDDLYFNVDLIVRGADLWDSTLAQQYLAIKLSQPRFADVLFHHHKLLSGADGSKLSKSAGSTSIQYLRAHGATAEEIYNMAGRMAGMGNVRNLKEFGEKLTMLL